MDDDLLEEIADMIFSIIIGYVGALEFLYVVRHLYHWSARHNEQDQENNEADSLERLQDNLRAQIAAANEKETATGQNAMQDGVLYEKGFRIDPNQKEIEKLKHEQRSQMDKEKRRKEIEAELKKQQQIGEQTRKQLDAAEAALAKQKQQAEEDKENERILLEAERAREAEQRRLEIEKEEELARVKATQMEQAEKERLAQQKADEEAAEAEAEAEAVAEQAKKAEDAKAEAEALVKEANAVTEMNGAPEAESVAAETEAKAAEAKTAAGKAEAADVVTEAEAMAAAEAKAIAAAEAEAIAAAEAEAIAAAEAEAIAAAEFEAITAAEAEAEAIAAEAEAEAAESARLLLEAERQREEEQRMLELQEEEEALENARRIIASDKLREIAQLQQLEDSEIEAEDDAVENPLKKLKPINEQTAAVSQMLQAEQINSERERKQKLIAENARKFLEAELEMVELQQRQHQTPTTSIEEPIVRVFAPAQLANEPVVHKVKTQFGQTSKLLFPSVSDDGSSIEPDSSPQTSLSTQPSEEIPTTGTEDAVKNKVLQQQQYAQLERQEPDGEDNENNNYTIPTLQYTDEYLRSLDGIKSRPLVREDGSGRRRAFKKRRSSGSSNSSRDSRTSREEELKMFTSLEEEEFQNLQKSDSDFIPIKYSGEQTLKVKSHHRRHKRSPAKDLKPHDDTLRASLEMLGEESTNPWGEIVPEHYKETEFWKREKALSIDEENIEPDQSNIGIDITDVPKNSLATATSFEEATDNQNEEALAALKQQQTIEDLEQATEQEKEQEQQATAAAAAAAAAAAPPATTTVDNANKSNLNTSQMTEDNANSMRSSSVSPRLRRSPRIEEIAKYEEHWVESHPSTPTTPAIAVQAAADNGPWRDEYGLLMPGLSDFYDFTACINPSRSRSTSRNPSPAPSSKANTKNVCYEPNSLALSNALDIYDDTNAEAFAAGEFSEEKVAYIIASACAEASSVLGQLQNVADNNENPKRSQVPLLYVNEQNESLASTETDMVALIAAMRTERVQSGSHSTSRSRSHSPLPTNDNVERSLEARRNKRIKQNDELYEQLTGVKTRARGKPTTNEAVAGSHSTDTGGDAAVEIATKQDIGALIEQLRADRVQSHALSRSCSPLPTAGNIQRSLDARRSKRIQQNDDFMERLTSNTDQTVESPKEEDTSRQTMPLLVETLRAERCHSHSPLPNAMNLEQSIESQRNKLLKMSDDFFEQTFEGNVKQHEMEKVSVCADIPSVNVVEPEIFVQCIETTECINSNEENNMNTLVATLRLQRASRSRSKSPMRLPNAKNLDSSISTRRKKLVERNDELMEQLVERAKTPEPPRLTVEYVYEIQQEESEEEQRERSQHEQAQQQSERGHSRSRTPSRSTSRSPELLNNSQVFENIPKLENHQTDYMDFNLEASAYRTLTKSTEELESQLAAKLHELDMQALHMLKTADAEIELQTLPSSDFESPAPRPSEKEPTQTIRSAPATKNLQQVPCSPITPELERTISEELRDVQRIKNEMLSSGFKRSTYVGESMDLGAEYEPLRKEAAKFQRSHSPSPSIYLGDMEVEIAKRFAAEQREVQASILNQLIDVSIAQSAENKYGAKPKTERKATLERSLSQEQLDTERIKSDQLTSGSRRSTYVGESLDLEYLRQEAAEFRRSHSKSRSPINLQEAEELLEIEVEASRREFQDKILDEIGANTKHFKEFSRNLNADFLESERRASDSALIQKPETQHQFQDNVMDFLEPEEYHHLRRFSMYQETPVEEYPNDDFMYVSQIEVRTPTGTRTWIREDFYSQDIENLDEQLAKALDAEERAVQIQHNAGNVDGYDDGDADADFIARHDEDSNGSEDERQTVVEVDDEIDTDLADYNERGPTDESHHEISECEEADREHDRYAGRGAQDWQNVEHEHEFLDLGIDAIPNDEGAVGGIAAINAATYDSDSMTIDQIYNEAIKNRKQSGILRDYDCILQEMSHSFSEKDGAQTLSGSDRERYALWAKTRALEKSNHIELAQTFIEAERRDAEMRYLGDAEATARQSARLRSRYGYQPLLQGNNVDDIEVDLNYKPSREYNWRKNFKLDDVAEARSQQQVTIENMNFDRNAVHTIDNDNGNTNDNNIDNDMDNGSENGNAEPTKFFDTRKYSLGGESITLFSRSPDRELLEQVVEEAQPQQPCNEASLQTKENQKKKKKNKKKTRKELKTNDENLTKDDEDSENQLYSRRSSSLQMDMDSPKRISRSRRNSKASNDDSTTLFSPRNSVGLAESIWDINEEYAETQGHTQAMQKKKTKKRKKQKEDASSKQQQQQSLQLMQEMAAIPIISDGLTVSCHITADNENGYLLASISPEHSVCVTPLSEDDSKALEISQELQHIEPDNISGNEQTIEVAAAKALSAATEPNETMLKAEKTETETTKTKASSPIDDKFELLKDGNFYPLF